MVENQLRRIGRFSDLSVNNVILSPEPYNYRNTVQFHLSPQGRLGLKAWDGTSVVEVSECLLPAAELNDLWPMLEIDPQSGIQRVLLRTDSNQEPLAAIEGTQESPPEFSVDFPLSVHFFSKSGDSGTARVAHAEKLSGFIKRFAGSVIQRFTKELVASELLHTHELRMAARHQQSDKGETGSRIREERGEEVPFEMMNTDHGDAERVADRVSH